MSAVWTAVLVVGGVSLVFRLLPLVVVERTGLGERTAAVLRHAAAGAIAALVVLSVAGGSGGPDPAVLAALAVGGVVAWRGGSIVRVVLAGGGVYALVALGAALV
ncbi:AzlD domain-containing protein [Geodermatophilus sp. SYSU D00691]